MSDAGGRHDGAGVAVSRDPLGGDAEPVVWFVPGASEVGPVFEQVALAVAAAQAAGSSVELDDEVGGEGVGLRHGAPGVLWGDAPQLARQVLEALEDTEAAQRDVVAIPIWIRGGTLELGTARVALRTAVAQVRLAVALMDSGPQLTATEALALVDPEAVASIGFTSVGDGDALVVGTGVGASPGIGVGEMYATLDDLLDAADEGVAVIFVAEETGPGDEPAMRVADGILTTRGGTTSHAAVVARGWGLPAVCGLSGWRVSDGELVDADGIGIAMGTEMSIDGTTGKVYLGDVGRLDEGPPRELDRLLRAADQIVGHEVAILANADTADDARRAIDLGAEGIGLCRTEHQFLGDRLPLVRRAILAGSADEEHAALADLATAQRHDHLALLEVMDARVVTIRLLDPPLHEFLPAVEGLAVSEALGQLSEDAAVVLEAARQWREHNPMLGTRGVRLGVMRSGLYRAQARAVGEAIAERRRAGGDPQVKLLVPLVSIPAEFSLVAGWVREELAAVLEPDAPATPIGAMIETPRAALVAGELARVADFLSFGTNDLTQLTFGFSRDDLAGLIERYVTDGVLDHDPFVHLDLDGVGVLVASAVRAARAADPTVGIGVCGEHAGDPRSVDWLVGLGVDSLSCSPPRLSAARVAAARAVATRRSG